LSKQNYTVLCKGMLKEHGRVLGKIINLLVCPYFITDIFYSHEIFRDNYHLLFIVNSSQRKSTFVYDTL